MFLFDTFRKNLDKIFTEFCLNLSLMGKHSRRVIVLCSCYNSTLDFNFKNNLRYHEPPHGEHSSCSTLTKISSMKERKRHSLMVLSRSVKNHHQQHYHKPEARSDLPQPFAPFPSVPVPHYQILRFEGRPSSAHTRNEDIAW